jgi:hypothetical protein
MADISRELWQQGERPVPPLRQIVWRHLRRHGLRHLAGDLSGVYDVCSPQRLAPADSPHIVPSTSPNEEIAELLVKACPAGLLREQPKASCVSTTAAVWSVAPVDCSVMKQR